MDVIDRFERFYRGLGPESVDDLADVYDEEIMFSDPIAEHTGLPELRAYFQNLMQNCRSCHFDMAIHRTGAAVVFVTWTMSFEHAQLRGGKTISVDGVSHPDIAGDKIVRQRDYYDMGAMIYENVPMLGFVRNDDRAIRDWTETDGQPTRFN